MKKTINRFTGHIKDYHKHYLFGVFGGFAVFKLFLLLMGITFVQYTSIQTKTFAELTTGCILTGQYLTGQYETGCVEVPQSFTGGYFIDCEILSGYWTGGKANISGEIIDQIRIEEKIETGCILTGQTIIPAYMTGCYMTGGYMTGGIEICDENSFTTPDIETTNEEIIDENLLTIFDIETTNEDSKIGNGICELDDIIWNSPLSGSVFRDVFSFDWAYTGSDCFISGLQLQLLDHNDQWIDIAMLASGVISTSFDSKQLYNFQQSGLYHIIETNLSGDDYYLYTGTYTGDYSHFFSGYMLRLLDTGLNVIYETGPFTIDNQLPILTGVALDADNSTFGYLGKSGVVTLSFTANEILTGVIVTLGSGKVPIDSHVSEDLVYTYTWQLNSLYSEGILLANILFSDEVGNTGSLVYTSSLIFDITAPTVSGFVFANYESGVVFDFLASEFVNFEFDYGKDSLHFTGMSSEYLSAHHIVFPDIEEGQFYTFSLDVSDYVHNTRGITGDFIKTVSGDIVSHVYIVPIISLEELSGDVVTLATILKKEIEKYSICKESILYTPVELQIRHNTYTLQMPNFQKSQVKLLVNAFSLFVLDQIKNNYTMTTTDIDEITKKFNNFLIILKLLRDDDNSCKQNLSNYHIEQFKNVLQEFKIELE